MTSQQWLANKEEASDNIKEIKKHKKKEQKDNNTQSNKHKETEIEESDSYQLQEIKAMKE